MPYALVPPGYGAVLIGQAAAFAPLEQDSAEGALFLVRLDFSEFPSAQALDQLEQAFFDAGVELWPGYNHVVYADVDQPGVYLAWQKGLAWIPIIVGLLVTVVLPPLLGGLIWKLLPQSMKDLISGIVNMGVMVLVMFLMTKMMPKPTPEKEKPKKVKEAKPAQLEEAKHEPVF
jgi:hypothetical protein